MRYSDKAGTKIYKAGVANVELLRSTTPVDLPDGTSADAKAPAKKGGRGSGFGSAGSRTAGQAALAKQDALAKLAALPEGTHRAYTDGGCSGNPGPAGSGVRLELADGRVAEVARSLGRGTNNIAELTAVAIALDLLDEAGVPGDAAVAVFSDSDYVNGVLTKGWKAKKNTELILELQARLKSRPGVELVWVAGHAGIPGNERADALATEGVRGRSRSAWT
ncbi:MAG: ribonuclease HI [Alphaproteobacteria bacterium]|nr:ribonuclease HI [Alphaproteobacteria bacterium]MCB9691196.1 ribonuclease HI [Alphaproteobacteria bacterium]